MPESMRTVVMLLPLVPVGGLAVDVLVHLVLARLLPGGAHVRIQFIAFGFAMAATVAVLAAVLWRHPFGTADRLGYLCLNAIIFACLGFGLFNVINANVSSLRVRMLKEYLALDPAPLPDATILQRYPAREILAARLARLEAGGQIYRVGDRYHAHTGGVVLIGRFFGALRRLLLRK
jgi:hypothetical protein